MRVGNYFIFVVIAGVINSQNPDLQQPLFRPVTGDGLAVWESPMNRGAINPLGETKALETDGPETEPKRISVTRGPTA